MPLHVSLKSLNISTVKYDIKILNMQHCLIILRYTY